jgi:hypothetical protein
MSLPYQVRKSARFGLISSRGLSSALGVGDATNYEFAMQISTVAFVLANIGPDTVFIDFGGDSDDPTLDGIPLAAGASLPFLDVEPSTAIRLRSVSGGTSDVRVREFCLDVLPVPPVE